MIFFKESAKRKEVSVIAAMRDGKILFGKRRDNALWTNPGGHLDPGEDPLDGAVRELREETGISLDKKLFHHLRTENITTKTGQPYIIHAYIVEVPNGVETSMKNDPDTEVHRWHWMKLPFSDEVMKNLHSPDNVILKALGIQKEANAVLANTLEQNLKNLSKHYPGEIHTINNHLQRCVGAKMHPDESARLLKKVKDYCDEKAKEIWHLPHHLKKHMFGIEKGGSMNNFWIGFEKSATELTSKARNKLPDTSFVFPEERKYPIHDKRHAQNALARVAQHGTPDEQAKVKAAVHAKFPEIGQEKQSAMNPEAISAGIEVGSLLGTVVGGYIAMKQIKAVMKAMREDPNKTDAKKLFEEHKKDFADVKIFTVSDLNKIIKKIDDMDHRAVAQSLRDAAEHSNAMAVHPSMGGMLVNLEKLLPKELGTKFVVTEDKVNPSVLAHELGHIKDFDDVAKANFLMRALKGFRTTGMVERAAWDKAPGKVDQDVKDRALSTYNKGFWYPLIGTIGGAVAGGGLAHLLSKTAKEMIPGGKAEGMADHLFNAEDLKKGTKVEMEHTNSKPVATEIAKDHNVETGHIDDKGKIKSDYYNALPKMEKSLEKKAMEDWNQFFK